MTRRMATHEPEITKPVDLCTRDGKRLNPEARGWSRQPLHRANLVGSRLRTKEWDYWAVLNQDLAVSVTYADVGYLGIASVWWVDLATGTTGGRDTPSPGARGVALPDRPGTEPLRWRSKHLWLDLVDDPGGTTITARWQERDGRDASLDLRIELPDGHESLNVVIPWSDTRFQYTSKHQARPAHGTLRLGDVVHRLGSPASPASAGPGSGGAGGGSVVDHGPAWGVLDVGRGRWPYSTTWNWGGGAGVAADGSTVVGLQFGAKWTEGTGFTENGVIVDGRLTKIGEELIWEYRWDDPMRPWRVRHPDGSLDVTLTPVFDRHSKMNAGVLATETHQGFGTWSGTLTTDHGTTVTVDGIVGFAEESRSRW